MVTQNVKVVYTADVEQYNQSLSEAMMATDRYAQVIDNAVGSISKIGMGATRSFTQLSSWFLLPKGASTMNPAIQLAAQYEQAFSTLSAKMKVATEDTSRFHQGAMRDLGKDVRTMSREYPISMGQSVAQFEAVLQAGLRGDELADVTEEMVALGAATGEMSASLTQSMITFSRTFDQLDTAGVDALTDSVTTMSSTFGASAEAILNFGNAVAPLAKQLGMTSTEVIGFSTAFAQAGESGMRAAGVFNTMLADMEKAVRTGAPQIQYYAEAVGMTVEEFTHLAAVDPAEAMIQFFEAIEAGGDDAIRILEDLGFDGVRAMKSITAVAESGDIRTMVEEAQKAYASGSTEMAAEEAFNGLADSIAKTKESMTQMVEAGAKPMVTVMGGIADVAANISSAFAGLVQTDFAQFVIGAGTLLALGGSAIGAVSGVMGATGLAKGGAGMAAKSKYANQGITGARMTAGALLFGTANQGYDAKAVLAGMTATQLSAMTDADRDKLLADAEKQTKTAKRYRSVMMGGMIGGAMMGSPALMALGLGAAILGPGRSGFKTLGQKGLGWGLAMLNDVTPGERWTDIVGGAIAPDPMDREINRKIKEGADLNDVEKKRFEDVTGDKDPKGRSSLIAAGALGMTSGMVFSAKTEKLTPDRGGKTYNMMRTTEAMLGGIGTNRANIGTSTLGAMMLGAWSTNLGKVWTQHDQERQKSLLQAERDRVRASDDTALKRNATLSKGLGAVMLPLIAAFGSMGRGISRLGLGGGMALGVGGLAGGLLYGSIQEDEAKKAASTTEVFAAAVGESTAAMTDFSNAISQAEMNTSTMASVMEVTADEMKTVRSEQFVNVLEEKLPEGTTKEQAAMITAATMQYQPAALQEKWVNMLADLFDEETAEQIAQMSFGGEVNPIEALGMYIENQKQAGWSVTENVGGNIFGQLRYQIARSDDVMKMATAAGASINSALTNISEVQGGGAALDVFREEVIPSLATGLATGSLDKDAFNKIMTAMGFDQKKVETMSNDLDLAIERIQRQYQQGRLTEDEAAQAVKDEVKGYITGAEQGFIDNIRMEGNTGERWAEVEPEVQKIEEGVKSFPEAMKDFSAAAEVMAEASVQLAETYNPQTGTKGMTVEQALAQEAAYEQAVKQQEAGIQLTGDELEAQQEALEAGSALNQMQENVLGAYENFDSPQAQAFISMMGSIGGFLGTQNFGQWMTRQTGKFQAAEAYQLEFGQLSPQQQTMVANQYQAFQQSLAKYTGSFISEPEARHKSTVAAAKMAGTALTYDEELGRQAFDFAQSEQAVQMQLEAFQTVGSNITTSFGKMREFGKGAINMEIQQQYMAEDIARQERYAMEDAYLQAARAEEDYQIQKQRATEDFRIQEARATEDYNKQVYRAEVDFNKQMLRAEEDYHRQVQYATEDYEKQMQRMQEDFEKSMTRAAEDMAYGMMDPYQRIGSERVWSAGGLIANIEEQNELVKEQLDALAELMARGLSEDAIRMLGLNDPKNAKQVVYLKDMTDAQIEELNRLAAERMALGEAMWEQSTEYERAMEDYMTQVARMEEDFMIQMQRMNEEFLLQQQRAIEDYNQQMMWAAEDFNTQMTRMTEDFQRSMLHMEEDFERSMARMWEDVERSLNRMYEQYETQLRRMEESFFLSFASVHATWEQMFAETVRYLEENGLNYSDFMRDIAEITGNTTKDIQLTSIGDMDKILEEAMNDMVTSGETSERELTRVSDELSRTVDRETREIEGLVGEVETFTTEAITDMDRAGTNATENINTVFQALTDNLYTSTVQFEEDMHRNLGDFAWMFEWPAGEAGDKEIRIVFDQASYDATLGSYTGGGMAGMSGTTPPISSASNSDLFVVNGQGSVSQQYGVPNSRYSAGYHTGIDISAGSGVPLYATISGRVTKSYMDSSYGNMVEIDDAASGINVMYAHMSSRAVNVGQQVERGFNIGKVGSTGNSTGPHVHVEARQSPYNYGNDVNPEPYLAMGAIIQGATRAIIGESGPEALIPLNARGADFLVDLLAKYRTNDDVRGLRTSGYSITHNQYQSTTINDSSVKTGPVTVVSRDPDQFYSAMRAKTRRDRLGSKV